MYNEHFEKWQRLGQNISAPIGDYSKATTDICRHAAQEGLEILNDNVALLSDQMKRLSGVRKPEDFANLSRECITEDMNACLQNVQKIMQLSMQTMQDLAKISTELQQSVKNTASKAAGQEKPEKNK